MEIKKIVTTFFTGCTFSIIALISVHWIVGNSVLQSGADSVYSIGDNKFVQCFCPQSISTPGIQSNWLPVSGIDSTQKQILLNSGWINVPDGSAFGLPSGEYVVQNRDYVCHTPTSSCQQSTYQSNSSNISNTVTESVNTGNNQISANTGASTQVVTGNVSQTYK